MERSSAALLRYQHDWELEEYVKTWKRSDNALAIGFTSTLAILVCYYGTLADPLLWPLAGLIGTTAASFAGASAWRGRQRRKEIAALAGDPEKLRGLLARDDGELVRVRGRILGPAVSPASSTLESEVVWQREVSREWYRLFGTKIPLTGSLRKVHERAVDFLITDEEGEPCWVDVADARLISFDDHQHELGQHALRAGDLVDVIGRKDRRVDPRAGVGYGREAPTMNALRASPTRPLLVFKVEAEPRRLPAPR
jgi:hypothetical protein